MWPGIILDAVRPSCVAMRIVTRLGGAIRVAARVLGSPAGCILVIRAGISSTGTVVAMWLSTVLAIGSPGCAIWAASAILVGMRPSCGAIRIGTILGGSILVEMRTSSGIWVVI